MRLMRGFAASAVDFAFAARVADGGRSVAGGRSARVAAVVSVAAAWAVWFVSPAAAMHTFSAKFGTAGSGAGQLSSPAGVAVDDTTGDVYVADPGNERVDEFSASGTFLRAWGWGVADGSAQLEVCTTTCQAGLSGSGPGEFETPMFVAVDNSTGPSAGDVYVGDTGDGFVTKFDANGNLVGSWESGGQMTGSSLAAGTLGSVAGVAVGTTGTLYVDNTGGELYEFTQDGVLSSAVAMGGSTGPYGLSVDGAGDVFSVNANRSVEELYASGGSVQVTTSTSATGVAADPVSGDLYSGEGAHVEHYTFYNLATNPTGTCNGGSCSPTDSFGAGDLTGSGGVAFVPATGAVYAADESASDVAIFVVSPPQLGRAYVSNVDTADATLNAQINPLGSDATYHFEYGAADCSANPCASVPVPDVDIGSGTSSMTVSQTIRGLSPATTYHYRVVASNQGGAVDGPDQTFTTYPSAPGPQSCPNAAYRTGAGASLPDCRAYELVTPVDAQPSTQYQGVYGGPQYSQASVTGDSLSWFSDVSVPSVPSFGHFFLSTRGTNGWSTVGVIPPQSTENTTLCQPRMVFYSADLSKGLLADGPETDGAAGLCPSDDPLLVPGEAQGYQNLFVRDNTTGGYQLVNVTPSGVAPRPAWVMGASSDLSRVVFTENAALTTDAPPPASSCEPAVSEGVCDLYEWAGGVVRLVSYLPGGTPVQGTFPQLTGLSGPHTATFLSGVSSDGSRVVFLYGSKLYMRVNADQPPGTLQGTACLDQQASGCTVQLDAPQGGSGPGGGGQFMWATPDGSQVFFTDNSTAGLTASTVSGSGQNLYDYDLTTGQLTDLTPAPKAQVLGLSGLSSDGAYVYFVADGALTAGATAGQPNLYVLHGGVTTFIATISPTSGTNEDLPYDACDWTAYCMTAQVSSNGRYIAFNSIKSLTGYDNVPLGPTACDEHSPVQASGAPCTEIYLYDAAAGKLTCVSCDPSGAPPTGPTWLRQPQSVATFSATFPSYFQGNVTDGGQVFFDTPDALVPADTDGTQDVYEYENGQLSLLSSGTSPDNSNFAEASANGSDVFIYTTQALVPQDTDNEDSLYDVRVDGGFPAPASAPAPCSGDACRGTLTSAPAAPTAATVSFSGPGNTSAVSRSNVTVLSRVVDGPTFLVRVHVPGSGRITISGAGIRTVRHSVSSASTVGVRVTLAPRMRRVLARTHRVGLTLRVSFAAAGEDARAAVVRLTVRAKAKVKARSPHRMRRARRVDARRHGEVR